MKQCLFSGNILASILYFAQQEIVEVCHYSQWYLINDIMFLLPLQC